MSRKTGTWVVVLVCVATVALARHFSLPRPHGVPQAIDHTDEGPGAIPDARLESREPLDGGTRPTQGLESDADRVSVHRELRAPTGAANESASNITTIRRKRLESAHDEFRISPKGTREEWESGYNLLLQAMEVQLDSTGSFKQLADGAPVHVPPGTDFQFTTFSLGREYTWGATEFPLLAELQTIKLSDPVTEPPVEGSPPTQLQLSDEQRQQIAEAYSLAVTRLPAVNR